MIKNKAAIEMGKLGGAAKAKKYDSSHYKEIGKKGALKRWGKRATPQKSTIS